MGERTRCSVKIARRASARAVELGRRAANEPIIAETAFGGSRATASSNHPRFVRGLHSGRRVTMYYSVRSIKKWYSSNAS